MTCPWDDFRTLTGAPNIDWCEASTCAWIDEPANTWSNLAYFLVAALLVWRASRFARPPAFQLARWLPVVCAVLGACSFLYHASVTFGLQVLDFLGMFAFLYIPFTINLERLAFITRPRTTYLTLIAASLGLLFVLRLVHAPYQLMIFFGIVALLVSEGFAARRSPFKGRLAYLLIGVAAIAAAATFSALDLSRVFCDPNDHVVQGHAIWHVLSAVALAFTHEYYATLSSPTASA